MKYHASSLRVAAQLSDRKSQYISIRLPSIIHCEIKIHVSVTLLSYISAYIEKFDSFARIKFSMGRGKIDSDLICGIFIIFASAASCDSEDD